MNTPAQTASLAGVLDSLTVDGELYDSLAGGAVRCYACGHRCLIRPGRRGICKVRFNEGGALKVPFGYVGALQCDPTEKKPFFHVLPGSDTLTFGMLGCDFHCPYCFSPETPVVTDRGVMQIADAFALAEHVARAPDAEIAFPEKLRVTTASGRQRPVAKVFKHHYDGPLTVIRPYYLPAIQCTPDHRVYAARNPGTAAPQPVPAGDLTNADYLAVPKHFSFSSPQGVDVRALLADHQATFKTPHQFGEAEIGRIMTATEQGVSSRQLGLEFGKDASYIRHVRSKVRRGMWQADKPTELTVENGLVRFAKEHRPGIPLAVAVDEEFAALLGYYCAEGSVTRDKNRPNSYTVVWTFGPKEQGLAERTCRLLKATLGLDAQIVARRTTLAVTVTKTSAALLFRALAGSGSREKRVPNVLYDAPRPVVEAFLAAYLEGDGHRFPNGKITATTVSADLAYSVAWLALKTGYLPSLYINDVSGEKSIEGRRVSQASTQYSIVWYETGDVKRMLIELDDWYLVPIRSIETVSYDGPVFNLEVEEEHSYLAGFVAASNCQNWLTSQTLRDSAAGVEPAVVTPRQLADMARRQGAGLVGSSYNEPLITSEWAVAVFKEAVAAGLRCVYISNGNATRETLEYIRPYVAGYKIDLKGMTQKGYQQLGGVLQNTLDSIRLVHEMGFWLEVVTLVIPGFNDSPGELRAAAEFLASVSPDIPWHVTAFHKDYKMQDPDNTTAAILLRAAEIGRAAGLRYVYAGNLPGRVGDCENTYCPECGELLIARYGYVILDYRLTAGGRCPQCRAAIPGIWPEEPAAVRLGSTGDLFRRAPRPVRRYRSDVFEP